MADFETPPISVFQDWGPGNSFTVHVVQAQLELSCKQAAEMIIALIDDDSVLPYDNAPVDGQYNACVILEGEPGYTRTYEGYKEDDEEPYCLPEKYAVTIPELEKKGYITVHWYGSPAKRYLDLNHRKVLGKLVQTQIPPPEIISPERLIEMERERKKETAKEDREKIYLLRSIPYKEYLQSEHWRCIRFRALIRASFRCQLCYSKNHLHVHHLTYERKGHESLNDLIALCSSCHKRHHAILPKPPQGE